MYEDITYEKLLERMLKNALATNKNLDSREGSLLWYGQAPAAVELQNLYIALDHVLKQSFADTASRDYLILRAAERGLTPYEATPAVLKLCITPTTLSLASGTRFSVGELNYCVSDSLGNGCYAVTCETAGQCGNEYNGAVVPIEYVKGLESCYIEELLVPGEDEEDTEAFRDRYFNSLNSTAFSGNKADYLTKINEIAGVGGAKIYRAWNSNIRPANFYPSEEVKNWIEEINTVTKTVSSTVTVTIHGDYNDSGKLIGSGIQPESTRGDVIGKAVPGYLTEYPDITALIESAASLDKIISVKVTISSDVTDGYKNGEAPMSQLVINSADDENYGKYGWNNMENGTTTFDEVKITSDIKRIGINAWNYPVGDVTFTVSVDVKYSDAIITDDTSIKNWVNSLYKASTENLFTVGGTVKAVIIDSSYNAPSEMLINTVQTVIDPVQNSGEGVGLAPIGHVVRIYGVQNQTVDISVSLTYSSGWAWEDVKGYVNTAINDYFGKLAESWAEQDGALVVRISQLESRLLNITGILDVQDTKINGKTSNCTLELDCIPTLGSLTAV